MSNSIIVRNHEGVLLDYGDPGALRPFHTEQRIYPADSERTAVIAAQRELALLEILIDHLEISEMGMTRIADALRTIRRALGVRRGTLGMMPDGASVNQKLCEAARYG